MCTYFSKCLVFCILVLLVSVTPTASLADEGAQGSATCHRASHGAPCSVVWNFSDVPQASHFIERLVFESGDSAWETVAGPFQTNKGITEQTMEGGFLYRAVQCADQSRRPDCRNSTVFWAPARPSKMEDIPDAVMTPVGRFSQDETQTYEFQLVMYNMALVIRLVNSVDLEFLPPMSDLPFTDLRYDVPEWMSKLDATIDLNAYEKYEEHRKLRLANDSETS